MNRLWAARQELVELFDAASRNLKDPQHRGSTMEALRTAIDVLSVHIQRAAEDEIGSEE